MVRADTISVFAVTGDHVFVNDHSSTNGPPVSGTISIDITTGSVVSFDLSAPPGTFRTDAYVSSYMGLTEINERFDNGTGHMFTEIDLVLPAASLIGYSGGAICSEQMPCYQNSIYTNYLNTHTYQVFTDGGLSPLSQTPEPSSLLLLGTGALGVFGLLGGRRLLPN